MSRKSSTDDNRFKSCILGKKAELLTRGRKDVKVIDDYTDLVRKFNSKQITR